MLHPEMRVFDVNTAQQAQPQRICWRHRAGFVGRRCCLLGVQKTIVSLFSDMSVHSCPHCRCIQPKVKKVGKATFMVQPLSGKQMAKNESNGITLMCSPLPLVLHDLHLLMYLRRLGHLCWSTGPSRRRKETCDLMTPLLYRAAAWGEHLA